MARIRPRHVRAYLDRLAQEHERLLALDEIDEGAIVASMQRILSSVPPLHPRTETCREVLYRVFREFTDRAQAERGPRIVIPLASAGEVVATKAARVFLVADASDSQLHALYRQIIAALLLSELEPGVVRLHPPAGILYSSCAHRTEETVRRLVADLGEFPYGTLVRGRIREREFSRALRVADELHRSPLVFHHGLVPGSASLTRLIASAMGHRGDRGIGLVLLDRFPGNEKKPQRGLEDLVGVAARMGCVILAPGSASLGDGDCVRLLACESQLRE